MRYEIRTHPDGYPQLYRHGELCRFNASIPSNSTLEFWQEIQRLEENIVDLRTTVRQWEEGTAAMKEGVGIRIANLEEENRRLISAIDGKHGWKEEYKRLQDQRDAAIAERDQLARKVAHGCTDATCPICEVTAQAAPLDCTSCRSIVGCSRARSGGPDDMVCHTPREETK